MTDERKPADLTVGAYHAAKDKAKRGPAEKASFRELLNDLKRRPAAEEHLLFELLGSTLRALHLGHTPEALAGAQYSIYGYDRFYR